MQRERRMTTLKWIGSLSIPVFLATLSFAFLFYIVVFARGMLFSSLGWLCIITLVLGGIIPIFLTISKSIDTSRYVLFKLITLAITIVTVFLGAFFWVWVIGSVLFSIIKYAEHSNGVWEWLTAFLPNPQIYLSILHLLFYINLSGLSEGLSIPG